MAQRPHARARVRQLFQTLLMAGVLPVVAFAVLEDQFGVEAGLIGGMAFGVFEILYEWKSRGKVEALTWAGNLLILILGGVSLWFKDGIWFKLQPALIAFLLGTVLFSSVLADRPLMFEMARRQQEILMSGRGLAPEVEAKLKRALSGLTGRLALFLWIQAGIGLWAALYAKTHVWAAIKGVGFTASLVVYLVVETLLLRYRIRHS